MTWFKNVTRIRKWGIATQNYFFGVYEELTESVSNYTSNATAYINDLESLEDLDSVQIKRLSKKALATGSALICNKSLREKAFNIICGASINMLV